MRKEQKDNLQNLRMKLNESKSDQESVEKYVLDYFSKTKEEQLILELDLEVALEDLNRLGWMSLPLIFIVPAINSIYKGWLMFLPCILFYVVVARIIIKESKKCKFYKKYLLIIEKIKKGIICESTKTKITTIRYNFDNDID